MLLHIYINPEGMVWAINEAGNRVVFGNADGVQERSLCVSRQTVADLVQIKFRAGYLKLVAIDVFDGDFMEAVEVIAKAAYLGVGPAVQSTTESVFLPVFEQLAERGSKWLAVTSRVNKWLAARRHSAGLYFPSPTTSSNHSPALDFTLM